MSFVNHTSSLRPIPREDGDEFLTLHEVSGLTGYSGHHVVHGFVKKHGLKCEKILYGKGYQRFFLRSEVESFLRQYPAKEDTDRNTKFRQIAEQNRQKENEPTNEHLVSSLRPVASNGDEYLSLSEISELTGYTEGHVVLGLIKKHGLKCTEIPQGARRIRFILRSDVESFLRQYPAKDDRHRNMKFRQLAREKRKNECIPTAEEILRKQLDDQYGKTKQIAFYLTSIDVATEQEFRNKFISLFNGIKSYADVRLRTVGGSDSLVTLCCGEEVVLWNVHVRRSLLDVGETFRFRKDDELDIRIDNYEGNKISFYFATNFLPKD